MTKDSALFNHTLDSVVKNRLPANYHKTVSLTYKEEFNGYHENVKDFVIQIMRITDMIKVENIEPKKVLEDARKDQHERVRNFYELAIPIVEKYFRPEELFEADSAFFCGTAAEITAIESIEGQTFQKPWKQSLGVVIQEAYQSIVLDKSYSYVIV